MNEKGLTKKEAEKRLGQYGLNEIKDISKVTPLKILLRQIKNNFILYLLAVAMLISFFVGKSVTAYTILTIIITIIALGFIQEYRSEKAINSLKNMLVPISIVLRDGKEQEVQSIHIVPGDILVLRSGEKIPADCIILEEKELRVNESVLTGESREIKKFTCDKNNHSDENLLFMGSFVVNGKAIAKVIHTGMNSRFGKISDLISNTEKEHPLQKKVNNIAKYIAILGFIVSILTGLIMFFMAESINYDVIINILIIVIALSVSAFPEAFPIVLTTTLSNGAYRMARSNAIVNRMSVIETLGETTVICSDKTGTITKGEMTVKKIFQDNVLVDVSGTGYEGNGDFLIRDKKINLSSENVLVDIIHCSILCNDSKIERTGEDKIFHITGSPTEASLLVMAAKADIYNEDLNFERIEEIPFNSERKMMSVLCKTNKGNIVYSKGALEFLLKKCKYIQRNNGVFTLTEKDKKRIVDQNKEMTSDCLRTLAFAHKKTKGSSKNDLEKDLVFLGLVGIEDPPRDEVKESIRQCVVAGITVKMITGDNKETALSIAEQIGLNGKVLLGQELDNINDEELQKIISSVSIFARVKPEHKLRIIQALKFNGEIVTMTGDGVNDAPALKEAHIGVAMGKNGTDVSRSVADLTLKDDNFSTIVLAIREGRTIFKNLRKFVTYQLSCNFAELSILFLGVVLSPLLGWQVPLLLALQILFMNMVTADFPAVALGLNKHSKDAMFDKPRKNSEILDKKLIGLLIFNGTLMMGFVLLSYFLSFNIFDKSVEYSRTVALMTLILLEISSAFSFRSFRKGVLNRGLLANPYLFYAAAISLIATIVIIYTPLNKVFETVPLSFGGFVTGIFFSLLLVAIFDISKYVNNRRNYFDFEH